MQAKMQRLQTRSVRTEVTKTSPRCPPPRATAAQTVGTIAASDLMELGKSGLKVPVVGVGAWSWGDRSGYWGYGKQYGKEESREAYKAIMESGLTFIDTAEVYGFGYSESFLGEFMRETGTRGTVQIATKYAPLPWRLTSGSVPAACQASLSRLGLSKASLYMQHWPNFVLPFLNDALIDGLIKVKQQGLADAVGVSNFKEERVRRAAKRMAEAGVVLASNQVQYSLLYRYPERNGVLEACRENGVTLVAYSPMCQGLLTGKYKVGGEKPYGTRAALFSDDRIRQIEPLIDLMRKIGEERGKSLAQIALNWCVCKGTLPIPGAKNRRQVEEIAGALGWRLSDGEVAELDKVSGKIPPSLGAPFENW